MTDRRRVVLVRPWVDAHAGAGCCSADTRDPIALEQRVCGPVEHAAETRVTAACYRLLREQLPEVDVQLVSASNTAYLLPTTFAAARRRGGVVDALRECLRAPTAGAVLVDGERIGDVAQLGPGGVVAVVRRHLEQTQPG
ncbi:hypothetical protein BH24ACT8_BH24ACT8_10430 [soil metagenome]